MLNVCMALQFLGLFGDVKSIKKAEDQHAKLFRRSTSELRKRSADDFLSSDRTKMAKIYNGTTPAQPVSAQAQWSGGYAAQPQTWPQAQAAPAQPQQWNPTYGQQQVIYKNKRNHLLPCVYVSSLLMVHIIHVLGCVWCIWWISRWLYCSTSTSARATSCCLWRISCAGNQCSKLTFRRPSLVTSY